uniref:Uncharacterized protein n=1 Tax=Timema tahoe TaxID=61484 RepID=A0A7R9IB47_9NEOP|nr:unnamed protein product [Timema tahoe]
MDYSLFKHAVTTTMKEVACGEFLRRSSPSADLVPTLLGMYDALIGRAPSEGAAAAPKQPPPRLMESVVFSRPLSVSSIASSSSSSSSGTSSCSGGGRRLGAAPKSSAYLASIESLEDDSEEEARLKCSQEVDSSSEGLN